MILADTLGFAFAKNPHAVPSLSRPVRIFSICDFYFCRYKIVYFQEILENSELSVLTENSWESKLPPILLSLTEVLLVYTHFNFLPNNYMGLLKYFKLK